MRQTAAFNMIGIIGQVYLSAMIDAPFSFICFCSRRIARSGNTAFFFPFRVGKVAWAGIFQVLPTNITHSIFPVEQ